MINAKDAAQRSRANNEYWTNRAYTLMQENFDAIMTHYINAGESYFSIHPFLLLPEEYQKQIAIAYVDKAVDQFVLLLRSLGYDAEYDDDSDLLFCKW